jgi:hypothetical protein
VGFTFGICTNFFYLRVYRLNFLVAVGNDLHGWDGSLMALSPGFFPYLGIQVSAIALSLIARARWFGLQQWP